MATVLSPRPWEPRLVQEAADSGLVRLIARCYDPHDVPEVDALVIGIETPWLDTKRILEWRLRGIAVIGMFPIGDRAAVALLCRAGVDQLFAETAEPILVLRAACELTAMGGHHLSKRLRASS